MGEIQGPLTEADDLAWGGKHPARTHADWLAELRDQGLVPLHLHEAGADCDERCLPHKVAGWRADGQPGGEAAGRVAELHSGQSVHYERDREVDPARYVIRTDIEPVIDAGSPEPEAG